MTFTTTEVIDSIATWLVTGELNPAILAEDYQFNSPFWQGANRVEFIKQFGDSAAYQATVLSKITHFDPVIKLQDSTGKHFAIVLQYHTRNGSHVYETVFGTLSNGKLIELRSIYDLEETKSSLEL